VAEICRLTCLERGVMVSTDLHAPLMRVIGLKIFLEWDGADSLLAHHRGDHPGEQPLESGHAD
jgi:hypothetical protein